MFQEKTFILEGRDPNQGINIEEEANVQIDETPFKS